MSITFDWPTFFYVAGLILGGGCTMLVLLRASDWLRDKCGFLTGWVFLLSSIALILGIVAGFTS